LCTLSAIADEIHAAQRRIITGALSGWTVPLWRMRVPWMSIGAVLERFLDQEQAADYDDTRAKLKVEGPAQVLGQSFNFVALGRVEGAGPTMSIGAQPAAASRHQRSAIRAASTSAVGPRRWAARWRSTRRGILRRHAPLR
jgi:hypothetical protein